MEIATTTEFQLIYPAFVMHKHWAMPEGFNDRLYALAAEDAVANRIREPGDERNVGDQTNHLGHLRHNFLMGRQDPEDQVREAIDAAVSLFQRDERPRKVEVDHVVAEEVEVDAL